MKRKLEYCAQGYAFYCFFSVRFIISCKYYTTKSYYRRRNNLFLLDFTGMELEVLTRVCSTLLYIEYIHNNNTRVHFSVWENII